jgi:DNA-binding CsgD family transcriptional regulator
MTAQARERAKDRIVELSTRGHDLVTFWREATEVLRPVIPHYMSPCWFTLDPASLLITSHFQEEIAEFPPDLLAAEFDEGDVYNLFDVARSEQGWNTLHDVTDGDPSQSARWQANMQMGGDQEFLTSLRSKTGEIWGLLGLYREPGQPRFDRDEIDLAQAIAPALAVGARNGLLIGEANDPEGPQSPGLLVLTDDWSVESATPGVERWIAQLPDGDWDQGRLPSSVMSVAARAMRTAQQGVDGPNAGEVAVARVLSQSGTWIVLHGAALVADGRRRAAVIVEPAHPARIAPLLMSAYGLTDREQEVTRLVLRGDSTAQIAEALVVSPHTVQEHLKNIFEKTGVRSRRDLVSKVFLGYYEPRIRDNESRVPAELPLRGGPLAAKPRQ